MDRKETTIHTSHGDIINIGVCKKCNVVFKVRMGQAAEDGTYHCHECGCNEIALLKQAK